MPRYHFNILAGNRTIPDPRGKDLPGLKDAHWAAMRLAFSVRPHLSEVEDWLIDIADEAGCVRATFVPTFMRCR